MPFPRASQALSRFTVLDLTRVRSGPTCVRQLADWGANVIKIETPAHLEKGEAPGGPRHGSDFQNLHRNKRSITLDLKSPEGLAAFQRLVAEGRCGGREFPPRREGPARHRLRRPAQGQQAHRLASISGFGQDGPYRDRPGFDQIAQGMGGLMSITGLPGQGPVRVGIPIADLSAGLFCAHRHPGRRCSSARAPARASGSGPRCCRRRSSCSTSRPRAGCMRSEVAKQAGNNHPTSIPTGVFKTKDGYINIATTGQKMWERLCHAIGAPELVDARRTTRPARYARRTATRSMPRSKRRLSDKTSAEWIEIFNKAGVPCGPIYSIDQVFADRRSSISASRRHARRPDGKARWPSSASRSRCRARRARSRRRRRSSASTPTRCSRNSASADKEIAALHAAKAV